MRVARLHGPRDLRVEDVPLPEPGPREIRVRVEACGVCPTDVRKFLIGLRDDGDGRPDRRARRLQPRAVPRSAAGHDPLLRRLADLLEARGVVERRQCHGVDDGAVEGVAPRAERQPEHEPARVRVADRRALAGEVREREEASRPRRERGGLGRERARAVAAELSEAETALDEEVERRLGGAGVPA